MFVAMLMTSPLDSKDLFEGPSITGAIATLLSILGASRLNTFCVSVLYRIRSTVDIPGEIARIQWIASVMTMRARVRWAIPAAGAFVEELVFRGGIFLDLSSAGAPCAVAAIASSLLSCAGQVVLLSTPVQIYIMASASLTLGIVGYLLVATMGNLIPTLLLHTSFAAYYTNMSTSAVYQAAHFRGGQS